MRWRFSVLAGVAFLAWAGAGQGEEPMHQGRVVDEKGRPIAGAEVYRQWDGFSCAELQRRREEPEKAATDREGRFSFPIPHSGQVRLVVFAPNHVPLSTPKFGLCSTKACQDLPPITLERGVLVSGRAVDGLGRPLAGVGLWIAHRSPAGGLRPRRPGAVLPPELLTDATGSFEFAVPRGETFSVAARRQDRSSAYQSGLMPSFKATLTLILLDRVRVSGQVVDEEGAPVRGATVELRNSDIEGTEPPEPLAADEDGRFVLPPVEVGVASLSIAADGFETRYIEAEVDLGGEAKELVVTLRRTAEVAGRVTLASGEGVAEATVGWEGPEVQRLGCGEGGGNLTLTDAQGYYRLAGVPVGTRTIGVSRLGGSQAQRRVDVEIGVTALDLVLPPVYEVSGRVVDEHGLPVERAQLEIGPRGRSVSLASPHTQADGSFTTALVDGDYEVTVSPPYRPGHPMRGPLERIAQFEVAGGSVSGLEIRLPPPAEILVRVKGLTPAELSEVRVNAERAAWRKPQAEPDGRGGFHLAGLEAGVWTVRAHLPIQRRSVGAVAVLEAGASETLELDASAGLALRGLATLVGQPLGSAMVVLEGIDRVEHAGVQTGSDGRFEIASVSPGRYRATAHSLGNGKLELREVEIRAGEELALDFRTVQ